MNVVNHNQHLLGHIHHHHVPHLQIVVLLPVQVILLPDPLHLHRLPLQVAAIRHPDHHHQAVHLVPDHHLHPHLRGVLDPLMVEGNL